jgi:uroporphyrinogen-III synthase
MNSLQQIRIAVTRALSQSEELAAPLRAEGATVHVCPLIRIEGNVDAAEWRRVRERLMGYTWLVFTSANGVERFVQLLHEANIAPAALTGCRVACVGPATANVAQARGFSVSLIPDQYLGAVVADALADAGPLVGEKILIARAAGGGAELPAGLRARGAEVDDFELYRSVADDAGARSLRTLMSSGNVDLLTFTSGSAVTYFVEKIGNPADTAVAVIGPSTAQVARRLGLRVDIEADPHTTAGLIKAIIDYYAADGGESEV